MYALRRAGTVLAAIGFIVAGGFRCPSWAQDATSPVDSLYADLAKLPPAERQKQLEDGARKEGSLSIVHTLRGELGSDHIDLFRKRYPFLKVDVNVDIGSQDAAERLVAEETTRRHLTDVITIALPDMVEPARLGFIAHYPTPATAAILPRYQRMGAKDNLATTFYWSEHGISYNSSMVPKERAPKDWMDLCDPFFKGNVSFDPAEARYLSGLYSIMGMDGAEKFLKCIGANEPIIQRGHSQRTELMLAGDHMVQGDNYLYYGLQLQKKTPSLPYAMVFTSAIMANLGVSVTNRNTPHPYAAALFTDWTLTDESQHYLSDQGRGPVTLKHPFLPEDVNLVDNIDPPKEEAAKLMQFWRTYVEKRGR